MKDLARPPSVKLFNRFLEVSSPMSHASEEGNRIAGTVAAFRAARSKGVSIPDAIKSAENALRKAPNFAPHNKPRIATERGPLGRFGAPIMQFKLFGLTKTGRWSTWPGTPGSDIDPAARKEASYGLIGAVMMHALTAGVLTGMPIERAISAAPGHPHRTDPTGPHAGNAHVAGRSIGPTGRAPGRGAPHAVGLDFAHGQA